MRQSLDRQTDRQSIIRLIQYVFGYAPVELRDIAKYAKDRICNNELTVENYIGVENLLQDRAGKRNAERVPEKGNSIKFNCEDILIGNIRPYLKKIWFADCAGGTNGDVLVVQVMDKEFAYPNYLYYVLAADGFFKYDNQNAKGAKMPRGNKDAIMSYQFYLPTLDKQKQIAETLDRFDKLCNDISEGLPAEIEARQKQYEYYRDKLLNFKIKE